MTDVSHVRFAASRCPYCGKQVDSASMLAGDVPPPSKGDLAVCFGCGEVMQFGASMQMEPISPDELATLSFDELADMRKTQSAIRAFLKGELK